ncbi:LacI family DNA-binding transcriptional regulator [Marinactinospora rubrisoli]|uniref:LacI family DNA-binding transcriptional regulator n=1 Tax=Marinactinospora rubrisoli TaxID=2715399 RepID=A0ABW2KMN4_9ACTN
MAGLEDVARAAGVSASTVSRAMSRPDMVAPATLERVRAAAAELGFRANPAARALTTGRTGYLAMVVPDLHNPFYGGVISGAQRAAERRDVRLVITVTDGRPEREAAALRDLAGQVDGFALLSPVSTTADLTAARRRAPVVVVNRRVPGVTSFTADTPGGLARIFDRLGELGHTDVGYLAGPPGSWMDRRRRAELRDRAGRHGLRLREFGPVRPAFAEGAAAADEIVASGCGAVLAYNSLLLLGLLFEFGRWGIRVPTDMSVAAADDMAFADLPGQPVTALRVPAVELGRRAADALLAMAGGTGRRPASRTLPTEVTLTGSVAAPPARR